jgi:hypothetical protein
VFGDSEMEIDFGNGYYEGVIYAASNKDPDGAFEGWANGGDGTYQAHVQGSPEFDGSLIVHSITERSKFNAFKTRAMDSEIDVIPDGYEPAPQLTYLNVAEHQVEIEAN